MFILENVQLAGRRMILPLVAVISLWLFSQITPHAFKQMLMQAEWLNLIILPLAALLCWQFGRSRLLFCCLLLATLIWPTASEWLFSFRGVNDSLLLMMVCTTALMWQGDRGFQPYNLALTLLQLLTISAAALAMLMWGSNPANQLLVNSLGGLHQLSPWLAGHFTLFEAVVITTLVLLSVARVITLPSNTHIAILATLVGLLVLFIHPASELIQIVPPLLAGLFVIAVLTDSFNMAFRDELTGIPSRRALQQYVPTLGRKYIAVMCDIDHFKKFNDTHGHDVGDQVLKLVASKLNGITGGGKAFRYGGEEFTLLFPRRSIAQVKPHVEAMCNMIAEYPIVLRDDNTRPAKKPKKQAAKKPAKRKTVRVTCSFGIAASAQGTNFEQTLKQADVALYEAKKAGRNCVRQA